MQIGRTAARGDVAGRETPRPVALQFAIFIFQFSFFNSSVPFPARQPPPRMGGNMPATVAPRTLTDRALDGLRRAGNPFRNYFARNPDDEVCARYHVPELYAAEREKLLAVVDLYRYDPSTHSEIVPILGNKGAGKTHLLHSIKHGPETARQMLVTAGTYQKDSDFLE